MFTGLVGRRDRDFLMHGFPIKPHDQNAIIIGHDRQPSRPACDGGGGHALWQCDVLWQGQGAFLLEAHDNHRDQHYETNDCGRRQGGHEDFQKPHGAINGRRVWCFVLRSIVHGRPFAPDRGHHCGKPAQAS